MSGFLSVGAPFTSIAPQWGGHIEATDSSQMTPLMHAAAEGNIAAITALAPNSDLEARDKEGCTALLHAAKENRQDSIRVLLSHTPKANIKARDYNGCSVLYHYVLSKSFVQSEADDFLKFLIEEGAEMSPPDPAEVPYENVMQFLSMVPKVLELGADPNVCDGRKRTLLMLAIQEEAVTVIEALTRHPKLNVHAADDEGQQASDYTADCRSHVRQTIIDMLNTKRAPARLTHFVKIWQAKKKSLIGHSVILLSGLSTLYASSAPFMVVAGLMASIYASIKLYQIVTS